jgi:osmoprotectant transport system permease protein
MRQRRARVGIACALAVATAAACGCDRRGVAGTGGVAAAGGEVRVGSKAFTESVVLAEIVTRFLSGRGVAATHRKQLGGTRILFGALAAGEIDVYPEYTGTLTQEILHDVHAGAGAGDGADAGDRAIVRELAARGLRTSGKLGFDDSYAIGMNEARAEQLGVRTISDLAKYPELRLAFSNEFLARADGWPALRARYGLPQREPRGVDHDVAYRGLAAGEIDACDLYTTDPEIAEYGLRVLDDDRHQFPRYDVVLLYRDDLPLRAPAAAVALRALEGKIDRRAMIAMNARAKRDRVPEETIAADFLAAAFGGAPAPEPPRAQKAAGTRRGGGLRPGWLRALGRRTAEHLFLVGISLLMAIVVAVPLGIVAARRPVAGRVILAVAGILQTIPSLALLVFMIPLLGIGSAPAIVALFLYSLLPIVRNTHAGLRGVPEPLREVARALGLGPGAALRLVELPLASPSILAGIKTSAVINVGTATLGALIGAGGYGQPILTGVRLDDVTLILEGAIPAALLALAVERAFDLCERFVVPRGLRAGAALPGSARDGAM